MPIKDLLELEMPRGIRLACHLRMRSEEDIRAYNGSMSPLVKDCAVKWRQPSCGMGIESNKPTRNRGAAIQQNDHDDE
jgi:hypothetical protein